MKAKEFDWQPDIDDNGASIGICPHCGAKARPQYDMQTDRIRWECALGHHSPWRGRNEIL